MIEIYNHIRDGRLEITLIDVRNKISISGAIDLTQKDSFDNWYHFLYAELKFKLNYLRNFNEKTKENK